ncbi:MAG: sensor histidine kinase [Oscillospiraceae bacterium]
MNDKIIFKVLLGYLKRHIKSICIFFSFFLIFTVIFFLYHMPIEPISYAILLCAFVCVVFFIFDFSNFYQKHKALYILKNQIAISLDELSEPSDIIENDYYNLILEINNSKSNLISEYDRKSKEMIDYYTLWVHQIKTPISAMRLLLQNSDNAESSELSEELFKIEQYVEMVLSYLRLGSNSTDFLIKQYSLDKIIKDAVRKYAPIFIRKKISLSYDNLNIDVLTDEKWLTFAIEQILSNALKYTNEGEISITAEKGKFLVIKDSGIGIEQEDLPRIFENGFTGYNGRRDKKASGIGLYLSKQILEKLSHTIEIRSEVGLGTTVIIGLDSVNIDIE